LTCKGAVPGVDRGSKWPCNRARQGSALPSNDRNKVVVSGHWTEVGMSVNYAYKTVHTPPQRNAPRRRARHWRGRRPRPPFMRLHLLSLGAGLLAGVIYNL
jgi:hypothetical protein